MSDIKIGKPNLEVFAETLLLKAKKNREVARLEEQSIKKQRDRTKRLYEEGVSSKSEFQEAQAFYDLAKVSKIASDTMVGGATLTKLLGTSAWYAPGASVSYLVNAIVNDTKEVLPCSVFLEGEYGCKDLGIGVPVKIGKNGFEEVIQLDLNNKDLEMFQNSVSAVKETNSALDGLI